jgi:tetratricopeptide (TPR) repeat protein
MGVVYEAEQVSLGRRVALKVLPLAATMDPRQLQRFHNEARAAASLHHEHIVPVYAVGQERGVHYYAMQFIDGVTLGEFLRRVQNGAEDTVDRSREPSDADTPTTDQPVAAETAHPAATAGDARGLSDWRLVARLGIDAAEALEHAHSVGVVHRDVKPGNLMLDGRGKLWVTDFGLARFGAGSDLTMTGDLVGTLRYMSPEQALAKHGLVDHRTDVYALGATLYELLTGAPAVGGEDKQEILRRIAFEEPARPRSRVRAIPPDLETIVLKAAAKEPVDRYATARALADDLRRFLDGRPVEARRPGLARRAAKALQRHRAAAAAAAAGLALAVLALVVSTIRVWEENRLTRQAYESQKEETALKEQALRQAEESAAQHKAQFERAEANFRALWALQGDLFQAAAAHVRAGRVIRARDVLRKLIDVEEVAFANRPDLREDWKVRGQRRYWLAGLLYQTGEFRDAAATYQAALDVFAEPDIAPDPAGTDALRALVSRRWAATGRAYALHASGRLDEAEAAYRQALALAEQACADLRRPVPSEAVAQVALWADVADLSAEAGRFDQAREAHARAVGLAEKFKKSPTLGPIPTQEARCHQVRGDFHWQLGERKEAAAAYKVAAERLEWLVKEEPRAGRRWLGVFLAWCPEPTLHDPQRAAELLAEADQIERTWTDDEAAGGGMVEPRRRRCGEHWLARALAFYRHGRYREALDNLEKVFSARAEFGAPECFVAAAALHKSGDVEGGRARFLLGVERMERTRPRSPELMRLRAEVAGVLQYDDTPESP